jgi:hypothetical protein
MFDVVEHYAIFLQKLSRNYKNEVNGVLQNKLGKWLLFILIVEN